MTENLEAPELPASRLLEPSESGIDAHLDALDRLASSDEPGERLEGDAPLRDEDGDRELHIPPEGDFLAWHADHLEGGVRYEKAGVPLPWTEHPDNMRLEAYDHHPELEQLVQDTYAEHGVDRTTLDEINAMRFERETPNCGEVSRSVAATLDGCPRSAAALDGGGESMDAMEAWAGHEFRAETDVTTGLANIDAALAAGGDGSHGIIAGWRDEGPGHYLNAAHVGGETVLIDAQSGARIMSLSDAGPYLRSQEIVTLQWLSLREGHNA
jgi:hypothetical protein